MRLWGLAVAALLVVLGLVGDFVLQVPSALLFFGAAYAMGSRSYARDLVIGVIMAAVLYVGFTRGLGLHLPAGVLKGIL